MRGRPARLGRRVGDTRARGRAVKERGPRWPVAYDLARMGTPIGAWLLGVPPVGAWLVLVVSWTGEVLELRRLSSSARAVRWCLDRHLRVHHTLGALTEAMVSGQVVGWLPDRIFEADGQQVRFPAAGPVSCGNLPMAEALSVGPGQLGVLVRELKARDFSDDGFEVLDGLARAG